MKTKLRSFHSFLMTERSLERYKVRDDLEWNEMLNIASNAGFLQAAPDKLKRLQKKLPEEKEFLQVFLTMPNQNAMQLNFRFIFTRFVLKRLSLLS